MCVHSMGAYMHACIYVLIEVTKTWTEKPNMAKLQKWPTVRLLRSSREDDGEDEDVEVEEKEEDRRGVVVALRICAVESGDGN